MATYFFIAGAILPVWASRIPAVMQQSGTNTRELGFALLGLGIAAMVAARMGGAILDRVGLRYATAPAAVAAAAALVLPGAAGSPIQLTLALGTLGASQSFLNVCINTQAARLQQASGRSRLSIFHAFVSLGGCTGAIAGVISSHVRLDPLTTFTLVGFTLGLVAASLSGTLRRITPRRPETPRRTEATPLRPASSPAVLFLGGLAFASVLTESAVQDWSALFAQEAVGAGETFAATVFATFTIAMASGRLMGDRIALLLGRALLVRVGALTALAGFAVALGIAHPAATISGFALVGLGMSCIFPQILSAVADMDTERVGRNIGTAVSMGYIGPLVGSPTIGAIASSSQVGTGLLLPASLVALLALAAGRLGSRPRHVTRRSGRRPRFARADRPPSPAHRRSWRRTRDDHVDGDPATQRSTVGPSGAGSG
ncbi:MFS transporter [Spiractinospora alimapuensis]|uniref:MFS transporter n=1 Tax=Spiractinospora alimapuensis TaxID=2820884 RepID=UPI001F33BBD3|nr:MFS transporter [Spiractinospora alimapuensis]